LIFAINERKKAFNMIEYNFYIDNMPIIGLTLISNEQRERLLIRLKIRNINNPQSNSICNDLMKETIQD